MSELASRSPREAYVASTTRSGELYARAEQALPGGNSRTTIYIEPYPIYFQRGEGCRVVDVDGTERIDFINNYTSLMLGHCHPAVVEAVQRQAGILMGGAAPTSLEIDLADVIIERVPSVDLVRFTNSGTEATMMAIRAARAFTGRDTIVKFDGGYHGTHDYASVDVSAGGTTGGVKQTGGRGLPNAVADTVVTTPFNDADRLEKVISEVGESTAAVIMEPVMGAAGVIEPRPEFLEFARELTAQTGIVLIFDEVISFRTSPSGGQGRFGITPDLTTLGKIIGGGLPVGAFGGRREIMEQFDPRSAGHIGHGGTFNANPVTMAAGLATFEQLTPAAYERLEELGSRLKANLDALFAELAVPATVNQIGSLFAIHLTEGPVEDYAHAQGGDAVLLNDLYVAALNHGVAFTGRGMGCLSTPMGEPEVDAFVDAIRAALADVRDAA